MRPSLKINRCKTSKIEKAFGSVLTKETRKKIVSEWEKKGIPPI